MHIITNRYEFEPQQQPKSGGIGSNAYAIDLYSSLQVKVYYQEPNPAAYYTDGRVRAGKHERKEFIARPKDNAVNQGTVCDQGYR